MTLVRHGRRLAVVGMLALALAGCGQSRSQSTHSRAVAHGPSATDIQVEAKSFIYLPDQTGGNFYEVLVLLRNTSNEVAIDVTGQISISKGGALLKSVNPTKVNILPDSEGMFDETVDLDAPAPDAAVDVIISVDGGFRPGPPAAPVTFEQTNYKLTPDPTGAFGGCAIEGTVKNTFTTPKDNLLIQVVGLTGSTITTGGFTYVDKVFPGQPATWSVDLTSRALCPGSVDKILVLPNLGTDKIFSTPAQAASYGTAAKATLYTG